MRKGVTLPELVVVMVIMGVLLTLALPRLSGWLDWLAVDRAAQEIAAFHQTGRFEAILRSQPVRLDFWNDSLRATLEGPVDSVFLRWPGPARHGVTLTVSRATIRFQANGLGFGTANTKLVLRRGAEAESLTASRLGRLRRWR